MRLSLDEMATFVEVVNHGSISKASIQTGIPVSTVSRRIQELEARLKVQLLRRTTRKQNLTDIGKVYFEHCSRMLQEAQSAELAVQNLQAEPSGLLRMMSTFPLIDAYSSKLFQSLMDKYPKLNLEFNIEARKLDLIEEKYDLAIIPGKLEDSSLISRKIGTTGYIYCASPDYLEKQGTPENLDDLALHQIINYVPPAYLKVPLDPINKKVESRIRTNNFFMAWRCTKDGLGIARLPELQIGNELLSGDLVRVIPSALVSIDINLVFPSNKQFTTKLRAAIDHFVSITRESAPWETE